VNQSKLSKNAIEVMEKRYLMRQGDQVLEKPEDLFQRVADTIAGIEKEKYSQNEQAVKELSDAFLSAMMNLDFLPNSPTLMNAGRELGQLSACFVLPVEDSMEGIFDAVKHAAMIHKSGGGTGFSFSRLRAKNSPVRSTGGIASGPISFMRVFNAATEAVKQGGTRRGANMGILNVDHPDILEFITCKQENLDITNFNISVAITDAFMRAYAMKTEYDLIDPHTGNPVGKLMAEEVFNLIVEYAWKNGEPGIVFIDRMNQDNPTPEIAKIESTNPCGEQPLLPYESCNLGSINLSNMVSYSSGASSIDWNHLEEVVNLAVRFLDNVIDANKYPLQEIHEMTLSNRKIGLGVMGFADMLIKLEIPYDSEEACAIAEEIMKFIRDKGRLASQRLAKERGAFDNFNKSIFARDEFPQIRNATITTIAPTGTISILANCSSGIEPLFALCYVKKVLDGAELIEINPLFEDIARTQGFYSEDLMKQIAESGTLHDITLVPESVKKLFVTAHEILPEWHVKLQGIFQKYTDNAVSKTINFSSDASQEDIKEAFLLAYELNCKGITVYRDRSREMQVLNMGISSRDKEVDATEKISPDDEDIIGPRKRPKVTWGVTDKIVTGCGNIYTTINEDNSGLCEVLIHLGKSGGCATSLVEAVARLISNGLRSGLDPKTIVKHLRGIRCPSPAPSYMNPSIGRPVYSCADAIATSLESYLMRGLEFDFKIDQFGEQNGHRHEMRDEVGFNRGGVCPECGSTVKHESGCTTCILCGYSKCG
jgi:ribonucleoside-diphosphate reductase alpha chain